jgi:probable HAF family extracellular repeat protein
MNIAHSINNAGQVVGTSDSRAFLWQDGVMTDLGALAGVPYTEASHINDAGQVSGLASTDIAVHAVVWDQGQVTDLGTLPGDPASAAASINNLGHAVGWSGTWDDDPQLQAVLFQDGTVTWIGPLGSVALSINDADQIVGSMPAFSGPVRNHAFIYADGVLTDLNTFIPADSGIVLESASGINNAGQIVGTSYGLRGSTGPRGFLLTPDGNAPTPGGAHSPSRTLHDGGFPQAAALLSRPGDAAPLVAPTPSSADQQAAVVPADSSRQIPPGQPARSEGTVVAWPASREQPTQDGLFASREGMGLADLESGG